MNRPGGVTAIAIWYLATGVLSLLAFCAVLAIPAFGWFGISSGRIGPVEVLVFLTLGCGAFVSLIDGVLSVFAGYGLLNLRSWARTLAIILAIFTLFGFPVGTIVGALILWYLFQDDVREAFATGTVVAATVVAVETASAPVVEADVVDIPSPLGDEEPPEASTPLGDVDEDKDAT
jgi:hypothetical protein